MDLAEKECKKESNCCIEIENSLVLILCSDVDNDLTRISYDDWKQKMDEIHKGGNYMDKEKDKKEKKEKKCNCCIEIEDSLVVVLCGEVDRGKLREYIQTCAEAK